VTAKQVHLQISSITEDLIQSGLCNDQQFPCFRITGAAAEISYSATADLSVVLKNVPYEAIYTELLKSQSYNIRMVDGALIQLMYRFYNESISSHRLAFFPAPDLAEFQNNADLYEMDELYADVIARNVVVFPLRFDFDSSDELYRELDHPRSHLTLGQYRNCRIPVSAPVTPFTFIDFVLRSFYNTAHRTYCGRIRPFKERFEATIADRETTVIHLTHPWITAGACNVCTYLGCNRTYRDGR
jgi:hypothetical protein